jgi:hypothetical protein
MLAVVGTVYTVAVVPPKQRGVLLTLYNSKQLPKANLNVLDKEFRRVILSSSRAALDSLMLLSQ